MEASPFLLPGWGTGARMPTPPWAPFPPLHPRGPSPLTPHEGGPSPPSLACPLLLRPCGHGRVVVGGAAVPGSQARSVWSVCLVGGRTGGPRPIAPPRFSCHPPRLPSLSGLLDRPSQWAALLKLGPESSLPHRRWGEDFGARQAGTLSPTPPCPRAAARACPPPTNPEAAEGREEAWGLGREGGQGSVQG